ncbi:FAD-binding oxidoreductase [Novosphingobium profundi]|uniref:NAD(P)/FAD-dependent oxidoreductase n=1 Tax=Novosphingobium profundi TaxID=1774954 RepID=UPI001BDAD605|nr:FAD-dependent oxidoreductase [Novosphingobium profundi]MBT0667602.1 FAD-binding oxidoreductase [Novosphingobium profundi]
MKPDAVRRLERHASLGLTETHDLRTGNVPWREADWKLPASDAFPSEQVDVAILGCGIVGAIIADRLSGAGRRIAMFDRRPPGCGSTAASTAQIMWAMDVPMSHLSQTIGETEAARRWRRVHEAVRRLGERVDELGIENGRHECPTLYLAGDVLNESGLSEEARMHRRHGLPSDLLEAQAVARRFGIAPRAAIVSQGGFDIDPVRTCLAMLGRARAAGASLTWPVDVVALHPAQDGILIEAADGRRCHARDVILATGYERATFFLPPAFRLHSTFAIATLPGTAPLWREGAMLWEAADPYMYMRTDRLGRIIAGGEDIDHAEGHGRNALIGAKAGKIAAKLQALLGSGPITIERQWAATFGSSPDGLPAIGQAAAMPHVWLAAAFGGNGIAFASLAADILEHELGGREDPDRNCFCPYRFG